MTHMYRRANDPKPVTFPEPRRFWERRITRFLAGLFLVVVAVGMVILVGCVTPHSHRYTDQNWREAPADSIGTYCGECGEFYWDPK